MPGYKRNLFLLAVIVGYVIPCFNVNAATKWRTAYYANQDSNPASLSYLPLSNIPWQKYTHLIQANIVYLPWLSTQQCSSLPFFLSYSFCEFLPYSH